MKVEGSLVSIVLPCYNERENILQLVKVIHDELAKYRHEIIVVDDNSPDGTYDELVRLSPLNVIPVLRKTDRGFAKSIRCGIETSKGDIVLVMDSDFNHKPDYLQFMLDNIKYVECVSASRFQYGGSMESKSRHYLSWFFNIFIRIMTGGRITDSLYGFFAIRRETLFALDFNKIFWGYGDYGIRLFYYLQKQNTQVLQFSAINGQRLNGEGNKNFVKVFKQYFIAVLQLTLKGRI